MKPSFGESNLGALVGAIVGATGGLFAVGIAPALLERKLAILFNYPTLGLACMIVSGAIGWVLGGQVGPRLAEKFASAKAEVTGGVLAGLLPVILVACWGWYMKTH